MPSTPRSCASSSGNDPRSVSAATECPRSEWLEGPLPTLAGTLATAPSSRLHSGCRGEALRGKRRITHSQSERTTDGDGFGKA